MNDGLLEITFHVYGFDRRLYGNDPDWQGCVFNQDDDSTVRLRFQASAITSPTARDAAETRIDLQLRRLILAWEYRFGCRLHVKRHITHAPTFPSLQGIASARSSMSISARAIAHDYPGLPPDAMPQKPLFAERWIRTLAEAGDFTSFPEEQLRRYYLIIEELREEQELMSELEMEKDEVDKIKWIRDFVSHDKCNNPSIVALVVDNLADAEVYEAGKRFVRFHRTMEHRNFIGRHVQIAQDLARRLIDRKIEHLESQRENSHAP